MDSAPQVYEGGPVEMNAPSVLHTDDVMVEGIDRTRSWLGFDVTGRRHGLPLYARTYLWR